MHVSHAPLAPSGGASLYPRLLHKKSGKEQRPIGGVSASGAGGISG